MIVTRKFVYIHFPKTGGTTVETALQRLHPLRARELALRVARRLRIPVTVELAKHGTIREVPVPYRDRPVLSCVRNPLDLYVSMFKFSRHRKHPDKWGGASSRIMSRWPSFPDLDFPDYVRYMNQESTFLRFPGFAAEDQPGLYTQHFLYFFATNLEATVRDLTPQSVANGHLRACLAKDAHFLVTHDLNRGLHAFLAQMGYPSKRISFIGEMDRVLPEGGGRSASDHWSSHYTPQLEAMVRRRERLLFEMFPELVEHASSVRSAA